MRGKGNFSTCKHLFKVTRKSPQSLISPFFFKTGTMGVPQSDVCTGISTFSSVSLASSFSTLVFNENGIGLGLKYLGVAFSF